MKQNLINIIMWVTIPIWFIPVLIYYMYDWNTHQEDYLKGGDK